MFPSTDGKKMDKYRPSTSEKNVNAAPSNGILKIMARDILVKLTENVQQ